MSKMIFLLLKLEQVVPKKYGGNVLMGIDGKHRLNIGITELVALNAKNTKKYHYRNTRAFII